MPLIFKNLHGTRIRNELNNILARSDIKVNSVNMRYNIEQSYDSKGQIYTIFKSKIKYIDRTGEHVCDIKGQTNQLSHVTHLAINDVLICNGYTNRGKIHPTELDYITFINEIVYSLKNTNDVLIQHKNTINPHLPN